MTELPTLLAAVRETAERTYPRRRRPLVPALLVAASAAAALLVIHDRDGQVPASEVAATRTPAPGKPPASGPTPAPGNPTASGPTPAPAPGNAPASRPTPAPGNAPASGPTPAPGNPTASGPTPAPAPGNAPASGPTPAPATHEPNRQPVPAAGRPAAPARLHEAERVPSDDAALQRLLPGHTIVRAWNVLEYDGHVILSRKDGEWCLSAPDPATDQPDVERGVTCVPPARFQSRGIELGIGENRIEVAPAHGGTAQVTGPDGRTRTVELHGGELVLLHGLAGVDHQLSQIEPGIN